MRRLGWLLLFVSLSLAATRLLTGCGAAQPPEPELVRLGLCRGAEPGGQLDRLCEADRSLREIARHYAGCE